MRAAMAVLGFRLSMSEVTFLMVLCMAEALGAE